MSDDSFIREVDEELRSDRFQAFWQRFGKIIIATALVILLIIAGYRYYDYSQNKKAEAAGDAFMHAAQLTEQGKHDEALAALKALESSDIPTYRNMARMRRAAELAGQDKKQQALEEYDSIAADDKADINMRSIARIRAAFLLVDSAKPQDVEQRVQQLTAPQNNYRASALEAIGLAYMKANDLEKAFTQFDAIVQEEKAPPVLKQRARILLNVIAAHGGPTEAPKP